MEKQIMEDLDLKIRTIKSKSENEIEYFVDEIVKKLEKIKHLEPKLRSYLEKASIYIKEDHQKFLNVILLSCILEDIGGQMLPFVRNSNIEKVKSICRKRSLNYNQLVDVTSYTDEILEIINSITDDK
jgi:Fe2+ transport system protein B